MGRSFAWSVPALLLAGAMPALVSGAGLIVSNGRPEAVLVLAEKPTPVATYAAGEMVYHIERASGVRLPILHESDARPPGALAVFIGETEAARKAGLAVEALAPEVCRIQCRDHALFIAGHDAPGDPLDSATVAGTLLGVYDWLERELGVRWLWPGELGTYVPASRNISVADFDRTVAPRLIQRKVRGGLTLRPKYPELGFTPGAEADYAKAQAVFLRRHRTGQSEPLSYGHAFTDWWAKYGETHPEWFQLIDGRRGPVTPGRSFSMCVSNPEFRHQVVELWQERRKTLPADARHYLNLVENGTLGLCECENCRAWDGPRPDDFLDFYPSNTKMIGARFVTDRYVRFWLEVQKEAEAVDPQVTLIVYNYFNYFHAPTPGTRLNSRILVGSYPSSGWFPRSTDEQAWFARQWHEWQATGARLFARGNYCLDGYDMPLIFAHQFADAFHEQLKCGLVATDYDAVTGQWATQGPNIYVMMRLETEPEASADALLAEYYSAFGAAAPMVKAYFDFWENYALENRERIERAFVELDASRWRSWAKAAAVVFSPETFDAGRSLLDQAADLVDGDRESTARVEFLRNGLEQARLCAEIAATLTRARPEGDPSRGRAAIESLIAFRRAHEREWIGNFNHSAWVEEASWWLPPEIFGHALQ